MKLILDSDQSNIDTNTQQVGQGNSRKLIISTQSNVVDIAKTMSGSGGCGSCSGCACRIED